jgi:hypothetical protein
MATVKRLQIMIDEDLDAILEQMAREQRTSKAALIRRFVRERVRPTPPIEDDPIWNIVGVDDYDPPASVDDVIYP